MNRQQENRCVSPTPDLYVCTHLEIACMARELRLHHGLYLVAVAF
jgi:hypothetical protein